MDSSITVKMTLNNHRSIAKIYTRELLQRAQTMYTADVKTYILPYTVRLRTVKLGMILGSIYGLIAGCGKSADEETSSDPLSVCAASAWHVQESDLDAATGPLPAEALSWHASLDTLCAPVQEQYAYLGDPSNKDLPWLIHIIHTTYLYHKQAWQLAAYLSKFGEYTPEDTASDRDQAESLFDWPVFQKEFTSILTKSCLPRNSVVSEKRRMGLSKDNLIKEPLLFLFQYYVLSPQDSIHAFTRVCHYYTKMMLFSNVCYLYTLLSSASLYRDRLKAYDVRMRHIRNTLTHIQEPLTKVMNFCQKIKILAIEKVDDVLHVGLQYQGNTIPCILLSDLIERKLVEKDVVERLECYIALAKNPFALWNLVKLYVLKELVPVPEAERIVEELKKDVCSDSEKFDAKGDIVDYIRKCLAVRTSIEHMAEQVHAVEQGGAAEIQKVIVLLMQYGWKTSETTCVNVIGPYFWDMVLNHFPSWCSFFWINRHSLPLLNKDVLAIFDQSIQTIRRSVQHKEPKQENNPQVQKGIDMLYPLRKWNGINIDVAARKSLRSEKDPDKIRKQLRFICKKSEEEGQRLITEEEESKIEALLKAKLAGKGKIAKKKKIKQSKRKGQAASDGSTSPQLAVEETPVEETPVEETTAQVEQLQKKAWVAWLLPQIFSAQTSQEDRQLFLHYFPILVDNLVKNMGEPFPQDSAFIQQLLMDHLPGSLRNTDSFEQLDTDVQLQLLTLLYRDLDELLIPWLAEVSAQDGPSQSDINKPLFIGLFTLVGSFLQHLHINAIINFDCKTASAIRQEVGQPTQDNWRVQMAPKKIREIAQPLIQFREYISHREEKIKEVGEDSYRDQVDTLFTKLMVKCPPARVGRLVDILEHCICLIAERIIGN